VWVILAVMISCIVLDTKIAEAYEYTEVLELTNVEVPRREVKIEVVYNWTPERIEKEIRDVFGEAGDVAVAVAKSESGGVLRAEIRSQNILSYGQEDSHCTFQVHAPDHEANAKRLGLGDYRTNPRSCVRLAYHIYKDAGGFTPWTEYKNGRYKKHL